MSKTTTLPIPGDNMFSCTKQIVVESAVMDRSLLTASKDINAGNVYSWMATKIFDPAAPDGYGSSRRKRFLDFGSSYGIDPSPTMPQVSTISTFHGSGNDFIKEPAIVSGKQLDNADEARYNLATRIMSNGVEVIIAGDKNKTAEQNNGTDHKTQILHILQTSAYKPVTLAPSTLQDQMILVMPTNVQENYTFPVDSNHFITKTCFTTYTYRTTYLQSGKTTIESRERIISNIATEERNYLKMSPTATLGVTLSRTPEFAVGVFHTSYTYYNTIVDGTLPLVVTSEHIVTNTITGPDDYISFIQMSQDATPVPETNTYYSKITHTKTVRDSALQKIVRTTNMLTQVIVTKSLPSRSTSVMISHYALDTDVDADDYRDENLSNSLSSPPSSLLLLSSLNESQLYSTAPHSEAMIATGALALFPTPSLDYDLRVYATKAILTTFTYLTTLVTSTSAPVGSTGIGSTTVITYRTRVMENVTQIVPCSLLRPELVSRFSSELKKPKNDRKIIVTMATLSGGQILKITALKILKSTANALSKSPQSRINQKKPMKTRPIIQNGYATSSVDAVNTGPTYLTVTGLPSSIITAPTSSYSSLVIPDDHLNEEETIDSIVAGSEQEAIYADATLPKNATKISQALGRPPSNTSPLPAAVSQLIGSLNLNRFDALRPVFNAMADLLQSNFGILTHKYHNVTSVQPQQTQGQQGLNNITKAIVNNKVAGGTVFQGAHLERPIYIPVQNVADGVVQVHFDKAVAAELGGLNFSENSPQSLHIHPPAADVVISDDNLLQKASSNGVLYGFQHADKKSHLHLRKPIPNYDMPLPLINGGISISPGEVITANSDVIMGRPKGIQYPRVPFNGSRLAKLPIVESKVGTSSLLLQPPVASASTTFYEHFIQHPPNKKSSTQHAANVAPFLKLNSALDSQTDKQQQQKKKLDFLYATNFDNTLKPPPLVQGTNQNKPGRPYAHHTGLYVELPPPPKLKQQLNQQWHKNKQHVEYISKAYPEQKYHTIPTYQHKLQTNFNNELHKNEILEIKPIPEVFSADLPAELGFFFQPSDQKQPETSSATQKTSALNSSLLIDVQPSRIANVIIQHDGATEPQIVVAASPTIKPGQRNKQTNAHSVIISHGLRQPIQTSISATFQREPEDKQNNQLSLATHSNHQKINLDMNVLNHNVNINVPPLTFKKESDFLQSAPVRGQIQAGLLSNGAPNDYYKMPLVKIPLNEETVHVKLTPQHMIGGMSVPLVPLYQMSQQKHAADTGAIGSFALQMPVSQIRPPVTAADQLAHDNDFSNLLNANKSNNNNFKITEHHRFSNGNHKVPAGINGAPLQKYPHTSTLSTRLAATSFPQRPLFEYAQRIPVGVTPPTQTYLQRPYANTKKQRRPTPRPFLHSNNDFTASIFGNNVSAAASNKSVKSKWSSQSSRLIITPTASSILLFSNSNHDSKVMTNHRNNWTISDQYSYGDNKSTVDDIEGAANNEQENLFTLNVTPSPGRPFAVSATENKRPNSTVNERDRQAQQPHILIAAGEAFKQPSQAGTSDYLGTDQSQTLRADNWDQILASSNISSNRLEIGIESHTQSQPEESESIHSAADLVEGFVTKLKPNHNSKATQPLKDLDEEIFNLHETSHPQIYAPMIATPNIADYKLIDYVQSPVRLSTPTERRRKVTSKPFQNSNSSNPVLSAHGTTPYHIFMPSLNIRAPILTHKAENSGVVLDMYPPPPPVPINDFTPTKQFNTLPSTTSASYKIVNDSNVNRPPPVLMVPPHANSTRKSSLQEIILKSPRLPVTVLTTRRKSTTKHVQQGLRPNLLTPPSPPKQASDTFEWSHQREKQLITPPVAVAPEVKSASIIALVSSSLAQFPTIPTTATVASSTEATFPNGAKLTTMQQHFKNRLPLYNVNDPALAPEIIQIDIFASTELMGKTDPTTTEQPIETVVESSQYVAESTRIAPTKSNQHCSSVTKIKMRGQSGYLNQQRDNNQIFRLSSKRVPVATRYLTNTQVVTVTTTETILLTTADKQSTKTLTLMQTRTATVLDRVTRIHTLLQPTSVTDSYVTEATTTLTPPVDAVTDYAISIYEDLDEYEINNSSNSLDHYGSHDSPGKPSVEVVLSGFIGENRKKPGRRPIYTNGSSDSSVITNGPENSIVVVMTDSNGNIGGNGIININPNLLESITAPDDGSVIAGGAGAGVGDEKATIPLDYDASISAFDFPTDDEDVPNVNKPNQVLLGGVLIATPPRYSHRGATTTTKQFMENGTVLLAGSKSCRPACRASRNELCARVQTRMRCLCRPGFARMFPDRPCKPTYTYVMQIHIHRLAMDELYFESQLMNNHSEDYRHLAAIAHDAVDRMVMQSDFRDVYHGVHLTSFEAGAKVRGSREGIVANFLLQLSDSSDEKRLANVFRKYLRFSNYSVGGTDLYTIKGGINSMTITDFNECAHYEFHDCSGNARCFNLQGTYTCSCQKGYADLSENPTYPGRQCSAELIGCERCNYHGRCDSDKNTSFCECFAWYTGTTCQLNLKILLIALIAIGTLLFLLLMFSLLVTYNKRHKHHTARSLMHNSIQKITRNDTRFTAATLPSSRKNKKPDKRAMIKDSSSESTQSSLPYGLKPECSLSGVKQPLLSSNGSSGYRLAQSVLTSSPPLITALHQSINDLQHSFPEQSDRSLTVMIPRAKYHPSLLPQTQLLHHQLTMERTGHQKSPPNSTSAVLTAVVASNSEMMSNTNLQPSSVAKALSSKLKQQSFASKKLSIRKKLHDSSRMQPHSHSLGALVSAGFEVSATVSGNLVNATTSDVTTAEKVDKRHYGNIVSHCGISSSNSNTIDLHQHLLPSRGTDKLAGNKNPEVKNFKNDEDMTDSMDMWLENIHRTGLTTEACSLNETTVQPATRSVLNGSQNEASQTNDEANTMAERDVGSTFLLPHTHLYKPESDISGFDSL